MDKIVLLLIESRDEGVRGITEFWGIQSELSACDIMVNDIDTYKDILMGVKYLFEDVKDNCFVDDPSQVRPGELLLGLINQTAVDGDSYSVYRFYKVGRNDEDHLPMLPPPPPPLPKKIPSSEVGTVHKIRMAKPSSEDFETVLDFFNTLNEKVEDFHDIDDEDLGKWVREVFENKVSFVWQRVLWAYDTLLNNCVDLDPDKSYLDFNADIKAGLALYNKQNEKPTVVDGDKETFYDNEIAPKLAELANLCADNGLSFVAAVEVEPFLLGETRRLAEGFTVAPLLASQAIASNGNADALIMAMLKNEKGEKSQSVMLNVLNNLPV